MISANPISIQTLEAHGADLKGGNKLLCSYVSRDDFTWIKAEALRTGTTMSAVVRGFIESAKSRTVNAPK